MIYDLHTHSTESDGTLTPSQLIEHAVRQGVNTLALTDHDCTAGLAKAQITAKDLGLNLINGVEISVTWHDHTIHVLGLNIDPENKQLQEGLSTLRSYRNKRGHKIADHLEQSGIIGALEGALKYSQGNTLSRTHFARFLLAQGYGKSIQDIFNHYLVQGKPGHTVEHWASLEQVLTLIHEAGGVSVVAHPARYRLTRPQLIQFLEEFKAQGGMGLEVISGSQPLDSTDFLVDIANKLNFVGSCGSDYHGSQNTKKIDLGRIPPFPKNCQPVWELWH
ncbi:PHP domain-containing protein [Candidatus Nitrosacidococcus sp. I8]|uniref:PHP domain-containing protein n=1 Tax=Candidatus Nitrosacidococcus sp. I8 TaxID=2942908 RepID=UPI00222737D8|nr:PHP domain-containing protein [Candidatus Nitrosacidococcus sp. I8]CAH9017129.1 5'-3' exoribonuclease [Candidatus Nitrosacidococcus sp. I8]